MKPAVTYCKKINMFGPDFLSSTEHDRTKETSGVGITVGPKQVATQFLCSCDVKFFAAVAKWRFGHGTALHGCAE